MFIRILAIEFCTFTVCLIHFSGCLLKFFVFRLGLDHDLLAKLIDSVIGVVFHLALEGYLNSDAVSFQFCQLRFNLTCWHLRYVLIHLDLLFIEDRVLVLLPDLLYHVEASVHLAVRCCHLLHVFKGVQPETPGSSLDPRSVEIVSNSQSHFEYMMESIVLFERLKSTGQILYFALEIIIKFFFN